MALRLWYSVPGPMAWDPFKASTYFSNPLGRPEGNSGIIMYGRWNWFADPIPDPSPVAGATALSIALTQKPTNPLDPLPGGWAWTDVFGGGGILANAWGDTSPWKQFHLRHAGNGRLEFQIVGDPIGDYLPMRTAVSHWRAFKPGVFNRIFCQWQADPPIMKIWVDGLDQTDSVSGDTIPSIQTKATNLWCPIAWGGESGSDLGPVAGDYAEGALWLAAKSDADARLYGRGASPNLLDATGRLYYTPMVDTEGTPVYTFAGWQHPVTDLWYNGGYQYGNPADVFTGYNFGGETFTLVCRGFFNGTPDQPVARPHPTVYTVAPATWPPVANFTAAQTDFQFDTATFAFTDTSIDATDWEWDFGDGSAHVLTQNATHVYGDPTETYEVTLTVGNAGGGPKASVTKSVAPVQPIGAAFAWNQQPGTLTVWFLDCSTGTRADAVPAPIFDWDWGDGTTHGTISIPQHTYATTGDKTVTLTVTNATGSASITHTVTVVAVSSFVEAMPATDGPILPKKELELGERSAASIGKRSTTPPFVCTTYAQLVAAFAAARYGDTIQIPGGTTIYLDWFLQPSDVRTWPLTDATPRMPPRASRAPLEGTLAPAGTLAPTGTLTPLASGCDPSYVLVTSTGALPAITVQRVAVEDDASHAILDWSGVISPAALPQMASLVNAYGAPHLRFNVPDNPRQCARWYFRGIALVPVNHPDNIPGTMISGMGPSDGASYGYDNNKLNRPDHIVFQQCLFDTDPYGYGTGGAFFADVWSGSYLGLINCWFDNWIIPAGGGDPKFLFDVSGPGPVTVENNLLASITALYFVGGSGSGTIGSISADWTIRRNRYLRRLEWIPSEVNPQASEFHVTLDGSGNCGAVGGFESLGPWSGDLMIDRATGLARPVHATENHDNKTGNQVSCSTWPAGANRANLNVVFQRLRADEPEISPTVYNSGAVGTAPDASDCPTATVNGTTTVGFSAPVPDAVTTGMYLYLNDTWWPGLATVSGSPVPYTDADLIARYGPNAAALSTCWGWYVGRRGQQYAARKKIVAIASNRLSCTLEYPYTHPSGTKTFPYSVVRCSGLYCDSWRHYKGAYENKVGKRFLFEGNVWDDFGARTYNTSQPATWSTLTAWAIARISRHKVTLLGNVWPVHPLYGYGAADEGRRTYGAPAGYSVIVPNGQPNEYTGPCRIIKHVTSTTTAELLPPDPAFGAGAPETFIGPIGFITVSTPFSTLKDFVYRYNIAQGGGPNIWIGTGAYTHASKPGGRFSYHDNVAVRFGHTANGDAYTQLLMLKLPEISGHYSPAWAYAPGGSENWGLPPRRGDESMIRWTHNSVVRPRLAQEMRNAVWAGLSGGAIPRKGSSIRFDDNVFSLDEGQSLAILATDALYPIADPFLELDAATVSSRRNVFAGAGVPGLKLSNYFPSFPDNAAMSSAATVGFTDYQRDPGLDVANYVLTDVATGTITIADDGRSATFPSAMPVVVQPGQFFRTTTNSTLKRILTAGATFTLTVTETWPLPGSGIDGDLTWTTTQESGTGYWGRPAWGGAVVSHSGPVPSRSRARCLTDLGSPDMDCTVRVLGDGYYGDASATAGQVATRLSATDNSYYFFGATSQSDHTLRLGLVLNGAVAATYEQTAGTMMRGGDIVLGLRSIGSLHMAYVGGSEVLRWTNTQHPTGNFGGIVGMVNPGTGVDFDDFIGQGGFAAEKVTWDGAYPETGPQSYVIGFKGTASDGTDPGANLALVQAMTAGLIENVTSPPSLAITTPTTATAYFTTSATVSLGGTAFDAVGVTSVTWTNTVSGTVIASGTASGTATWSIANIVLQPGANLLTVTAHNAADLVGSDVLTVTYQATAPAVLRTKFRASSKVTV